MVMIEIFLMKAVTVVINTTAITIRIVVMIIVELRRRLCVASLCRFSLANMGRRESSRLLGFRVQGLGFGV